MERTHACIQSHALDVCEAPPAALIRGRWNCAATRPQLHGKGGGRISACRRKSFTNGRSVCVCGVVVDSAMQVIPHLSSHAPLPPSRLIASRFVSRRLASSRRRIVSSHVMCTYLLQLQHAPHRQCFNPRTRWRAAKPVSSGPDFVSLRHPIHPFIQFIALRGAPTLSAGVDRAELPAALALLLNVQPPRPLRCACGHIRPPPPLPCSPAVAVNPLIDPHGHRHRPQQPHQAPQLAGPKQQ